MGINADDYISISSFTHHPFYEEFVLEVPDNFAHEAFHNVPVDELLEIANHAIDNGYTFAWDADVSEKGFSFRKGLAIVPETKMTKETAFTKIENEVSVSQDLRQEGFDNYQTTDDHLMHITGLAKDQKGNEYFMMKNSWGSENPYGGRQYISMSYFKLKTIAIMVHKDAIPKAIRAKMGIK